MQRNFGGWNEQVENFGSTAIMGQMNVDWTQSDIGKKQIDTDVEPFAADNVNPLAWNRYDGPEDKRNVAPSTASKAQIQQALAQAMALDEGAPEKVHVLEPEVYKAVADANRPNPRTTFYNQNLNDMVTRI